MAEVYAATAADVDGEDKLVAVKVIHPHHAEDPQFVQMLIEEARISALLSHPHIVRAFDLGRAGDTYFLVMEFVDGVDAHRLLRAAYDRKEKVPFALAAYIVARVCDALEHAHLQRDSEGRPLNLVHRDVSPQNVLLGYEGEVKLADFGIAKASLRSEETQAGVLKGKYYYMAPEQAWGDRVDPRTDVFSAGIVLYELLAGGMLYRQDNFAELIDAVRNAEYEPIEGRREGVPQALRDVLERALSAVPSDRFGSAAQMRDALEHYLATSAPQLTPAHLGAFVARVCEEGPVRDSLPPIKTSGRSAKSERPTAEVLLRGQGALPRPPQAPRDLALRDTAAGDGEQEDAFQPDIPSASYRLMVAEAFEPDEASLLFAFEDDETRDLRGRLARLATDLKSGSHVLDEAAPAAMPPPPPPPPAPVSGGADDEVDDATVIEADGALMAAIRSGEFAMEERLADVAAARPAAAPVSGFPLDVPSVAPASGSPSAPPPFGEWMGHTSSAPSSGPSGWPGGRDPFVVSETRREDTANFRAIDVISSRRGRVAAVLAALGLGLVLFFALRPTQPPVTLEVLSVPAGAQVTLNGRGLPGVTPMTVESYLPAGQRHELEVVLAGHRTWSSRFVPGPGKTKQIAVLAAERVALRVETVPPGALVIIDGKPIGNAPLVIPELTPGAVHSVQAKLGGFIPAEQPVQIATQGTAQTVRIPLVALEE